MKKLFLSICFLLFANYLLAQYYVSDFKFDYLTIPGESNNVMVTGLVNGNNERDLIIPNQFDHTSWVTGITTTYIVTAIKEEAFKNKTQIKSVVIGENVKNIGNGAFEGCSNLKTITFLGTTIPTFGTNPAFSGCNSVENVYLPINYLNSGIHSQFTDNNYLNTYQIKQNSTYILSSSLVLNANTALDNKGLLVIAQGGELVPSNNNLGIVEVETSSLPIGWHFIGAPFAGYALQSIVPRLDPSVCLFDYSNTNAWNNSWATINDNVSAGEGFFAYSWSNDKIIFTNYGDGMYSPNANSSYSSYNYNYSATPAYQINTGDFDVTKTLAGSSDAGHWMALANPYTFKLDVETFLNNQGNAIQGGVYYRLNGESWQTVTSGDIKVTEGFFVNFANGGSQTAHFKTSQRLGANKKASVEREFIRLAMLEGEREIELLFAQNEDANEGYDIFDANKLFSPVEITEPYFVTNNIALVKEEVNTLPYYATMNVRSYENKEVKFKANYIPEGYSLSLIDGEETIDLTEGVEYATNVIAGENADRFKVLIKKSLSIEDVEELQVNIYNDNRNINIETLESDLQIEVYNALGQKVFATKDRNFMLNNVSAGAYLVKAFSKTASKTQKIVVK